MREQLVYAPESSRQVVLTPVPVVFQASFAVVPAVAAAGWVVILTVTTTLAAGCST